MSTNLETLLPLVAPFVRNCPKPQMIFWLREAARTMAAETKILRETLVFDTLANQTVYSLIPGTSETEVIGIKAALYGGCPLIALSPEEIKACDGEPYGFFFTPPADFWLAGTPTIDKIGSVAVSAVLQPTITAASIPDEMVRFGTDRQAIVDGAIANLLMQPAGWGDPAKAVDRRQQFQQGLDLCKYRQDRANRAYNFRTRPGW